MCHCTGVLGVTACTCVLDVTYVHHSTGVLCVVTLCLRVSRMPCGHACPCFVGWIVDGPH